MELLLFATVIPTLVYSAYSYYESKDIIKEVRNTRNELQTIRQQLSDIKKAMREAERILNGKLQPDVPKNQGEDNPRIR